MELKSEALISILPLALKSISFVHFTRPDRPPARPEDTPSTNYRIVTPDYFRTMGISLLEDEILPNRTTPSIRPSRLSARLWRKIIFSIGRLSGSGYWLTIPTAILARSRSLELLVR